MNIIRLFSSTTHAVSSSLLAQLRKKTGFTLSNCRKALQLCEDDLTKAEEWLLAEGKRLGWEKAMKLQNRLANQGLIAIARKNNKLVSVEVNCETDFVARNEKFVSLAQVVARTCLNYDGPRSDTQIKRSISQEELANLQIPNAEKLSDYVAQRIGEFGENIVLRRGLIYEADKGVLLDVAVHPPGMMNGEVLTGKYAAFVAYEMLKGTPYTDDDDFENLGTNLCKHIIASNPQKIGDRKEKNINVDDELVLLNQEYMFNPEITVGELLEAHGVKLIDFERLQCGEE